MKYLMITCLLSLVLAEPPVGDSYSPSKSSYSDHYHSSAIHRSPSEEYGPPQPLSGARNTLTSEYGAPSAKSNSKHSSYGLPSSRISQEYGVPNTRAPNSEITSKLSSEYGVPVSRDIPSDVYGAPGSRSSLDESSVIINSANTFASNRSPSSQYGAPGFRNPSQRYGAPSNSFTSRSSQRPLYRDQFQTKTALSQEYGSPSSRTNGVLQSYNAPKSSSKSYFSRDLPQNYGAPKRSQSQHNSPLPTSYGVPDSVVTSDYSQDFNSVSQSYGVPNNRDLSESYGPPSGRSSTFYSTSRKSADLETNTIPSSSYNFGRSSLSTKYGAPSVRGSMSADQYTVPEQYNALSNEGYGYAKANIDEYDKEPASYDFGYKVNDYISGSDFGHTESRQDNRAEGTYFVVLPDGTKQVVQYEADERGFKPRISVEPVEGSGFEGYDDNAADLTKSADRPY